MSNVDAVLNYIRTQLTSESPNINLDTMLFAEGHLDSTAMLELVLWLGDTFNLAIQNEDLVPENFATVRNILEFLDRNTSTQSGQQCSMAG